MDHQYKIPKEYLESVRFVLERDQIPYECVKEENESVICTGLDKDKFDVVIEDAECEMQRMRIFSTIPVYSFRTLGNPEKRRRLMALNGCNCYHVLKKDEKKYEKYYGISSLQ